MHEDDNTEARDHSMSVIALRLLAPADLAAIYKVACVDADPISIDATPAL